MNYQIALTIKNNDEITYHELIESQDMVQLILQLSMMILRVQRQIHEDAMLKLKMVDDDIPF